MQDLAGNLVGGKKKGSSLNFYLKAACPLILLSRYLMPYGAGRTTALASRSTAVCANSLPFAVAPVCKVIAV